MRAGTRVCGLLMLLMSLNLNSPGAGDPSFATDGLWGCSNRMNDTSQVLTKHGAHRSKMGYIDSETLGVESKDEHREIQTCYSVLMMSLSALLFSELAASSSLHKATKGCSSF